jgi:hypothetical protein
MNKLFFLGVFLALVAALIASATEQGLGTVLILGFMVGILVILGIFGGNP